MASTLRPTATDTAMERSYAVTASSRRSPATAPLDEKAREPAVVSVALGGNLDEIGERQRLRGPVELAQDVQQGELEVVFEGGHLCPPGAQSRLPQRRFGLREVPLPSLRATAREHVLGRQWIVVQRDDPGRQLIERRDHAIVVSPHPERRGGGDLVL